MMDATTIAQMFLDITTKFSDKVLFTATEGDSWREYTGKEAREIVEEATYGLASLGIQPNDKVGILSANCPHWAYSDYAIACSGAASVTIYPTLIPSQIQYIAEHSESKAIFAQDREQVEKLIQIKDQCPQLKVVICYDDSENFDLDYVISFSDLREKGKAFASSDQAFKFEERVKLVKPDDLLTLIYTSGTTGPPKGVMLTHHNLVSDINASLQVLHVDDNDTFLSFLPLSHSFERMAGHLLATSVGATIGYAQSTETVLADMKAVNPSVMASVPRLYEKMYAGVQAKFAAGSPLKQKIAHWAIETGKRHAVKRKNGSVGGWLNMKNGLADKLVFSKVKELLGTRFRFFVSGGAPLAADIGSFFDAVGIKILEGYGLTETSPVITVNPLEDYRFGTVGPPIPGVEVKIAEDGEILTRGPNVMKGYYRDEAATREAINEEGWFYTGDIGIMEDGYLKITDRKKNLIVTAGGKNIAPAGLENALVLSPFIEQVVVIGDKRRFVSALIVPAFQALNEWAANHSIPSSDRSVLLADPKVQELFQTEVDKAMHNFARFEIVKKFTLLSKEFTIEDGSLTPSLKIKRKVVEERYKDLIDKLYEE
ncbi:MAG: long-chain fatty acid--CoA ligase [Lentisphaeria bacterium]|nr:long-chain fatty acid--CoA ligase [Candidatus Neomarinimicrobiota bacterium]MCF7842183.1 long-chain fatty acid--CoA ligase [Lentisphaeria bacterium]